MSKQFNYIFPILIYLNLFQFSFGAKSQYPIGEPGTYVRYIIENKNLPKSVIKQFDITIGAVEKVRLKHGVRSLQTDRKSVV